MAPTFQSKDWESEIQELLVQITPTKEAEQIVNRLAEVTKQAISSIVPEADVVGFANGNLNSGKAFGVAVPEVDIVATVSPQVLFSRLYAQKGNSEAAFQAFDATKIQKHAIRTFTDRLVSSGSFKFRRSAFRGREPKVTLLAPASLGLSAEAIPVDFAVNVVTPLYNAALLTECGQIDGRARELVLIVKRWAKDRGVCHASKGHLSPYLWGLLSIYFLQNGVDGECPLLPPFDRFETSGLEARATCSKPRADFRSASERKPVQCGAPTKSTGLLFKEFVHFFHAEFDWHREAVSIRSGRRAPPAPGLPLHIIVADDSSKPLVGPSIEDPFDVARNLGDCTNAMSLARLREELARAEKLCALGASLSELLEPWSPPESEPQMVEEGHEDLEMVEKHDIARAPASVSRTSVGMPNGVKKGMDWRRDASDAQPWTAASDGLHPWRRR